MSPLPEAITIPPRRDVRVKSVGPRKGDPSRRTFRRLWQNGAGGQRGPQDQSHCQGGQNF